MSIDADTTPMKLYAADVLFAAVMLIRHDETWTQKVMARLRSGQGTDHSDRHAVQWCAAGAVEKALHANFRYSSCPVHWTDIENVVFEALSTHIPLPVAGHIRDIGEWNDDPKRTAAEVREAMYRAAYTLLEQGGVPFSQLSMSYKKQNNLHEGKTE